MMKPIFALMKKDIKLLLKDKMAVFFTFVFPLVFAFIFGSIFSGGGGAAKGMKVAVTDLDKTTQSAEFVQHIKGAEEFRVEVLTEEAAINSVRKGKKVAFIIIPKGFGESYSRLFSGKPPELLIGMDPARKAEAGYLDGSLMKLGVGRFENAFSNPEDMLGQLDKSIEELSLDENIPKEWKALLGNFLPEMKTLIKDELSSANGSSTQGLFGESSESNPFMPLKITQKDISVKKKGPRNFYSVTIAQASIWAIMGCVIGFAVTLVKEKTLGTINRLRVAPITRFQILAGKGLGCFVSQAFVICLLFTIAFFVLKVRFEPIKLAITIIAVGVCFVGFMMLFASLVKTENAVVGLTNAFMLIMGMVGGAMIPLFVMPGWMQAVSDFSPVKWSILAFEGAIWRGFSYQEMMTPWLILLAVGVITFFIGTRMIKLEQ